MNEDGDPTQWIESVSEEQDACRKVARARRWSLNQTLAWISFGRLEPVAQDDDEEGLLVWSGIREALGRPIGFEITGLDEAWRQLAAALADGSFYGLGTIVSISRGGEVERHEPGQRLPPKEQAGLFMAYQLVGDPAAIIASPGERKRTHWVEYRDLSFKRKDILREFPADSEVIDAEFERLPPAPRRITFNSASTEEHRRQGPQQSSAPVPRRGRKVQYNKPQFIAEAVDKLRFEGGLAPANGSSFTQANLEKHMIGWCGENWEKTPGETWTRDCVVTAIKEWEAGNSS